MEGTEREKERKKENQDFFLRERKRVRKEDLG